MGGGMGGMGGGMGGFGGGMRNRASGSLGGGGAASAIEPERSPLMKSKICSGVITLT